ncbi:MAG: FMN-binding protein [Treponema sp.]|jgi:fumarate reductase flavoprotein subunit|nr:FMN-binding protein [Treponema sp.]
MDKQSLLVKAVMGSVLVLIFAGLLAIESCISYEKETSGGIAGMYKDGEYEGSGEGYSGKVHVWVQIYQGSISDLEILYHEEDELVGGAAMEELLGMVLDTNSTTIDAVSGATQSSAGFLEAVDSALEKASSGMPVPD